MNDLRKRKSVTFASLQHFATAETRITYVLYAQKRGWNISSARMYLSYALVHLMDLSSWIRANCYLLYTLAGHTENARSSVSRQTWAMVTTQCYTRGTEVRSQYESHYIIKADRNYLDIYRLHHQIV